MFELAQLRCFLAIAEEMHFGRAAARLNMTQPPLSRQLQHLERALGVDLVERSSRFVQLTAAGKAFLVDARHILRASEEALLTVRRIAQGEGGVITLGFVPATSYSLLPRLVAFILRELPHVQLVLKEIVTLDQVDAFNNRRIDAGILRTPVDSRGLALQLQQPAFEVSLLCGGLMSAPPSRPSNDEGWLNAPLRQSDRDAPDLLHRPGNLQAWR